MDAERLAEIQERSKFHEILTRLGVPVKHVYAVWSAGDTDMRVGPDREPWDTALIRDRDGDCYTVCVRGNDVQVFDGW